VKLDAFSFRKVRRWLAARPRPGVLAAVCLGIDRISSLPKALYGWPPLLLSMLLDDLCSLFVVVVKARISSDPTGSRAIGTLLDYKTGLFTILGRTSQFNCETILFYKERFR